MNLPMHSRRMSSTNKGRPSQQRMLAPIFDRGETADITLHFDGCAPYPAGPGGYGGVVNQWKKWPVSLFVVPFMYRMICKSNYKRESKVDTWH